MPLVHHELCFGCGRTNVFGLLMEVEPAGGRSVAGRCFIKQDHQGAVRGVAHEGVIAGALSEAMALACGTDARPRRLELQLAAAAPVGSFLDVRAHVEADEGELMQASARAEVDGAAVAQARGTYGRRA